MPCWWNSGGRRGCATRTPCTPPSRGRAILLPTVHPTQPRSRRLMLSGYCAITCFPTGTSAPVTRWRFSSCWTMGLRSRDRISKHRPQRYRDFTDPTPAPPRSGEEPPARRKDSHAISVACRFSERRTWNPKVGPKPGERPHFLPQRAPRMRKGCAKVSCQSGSLCILGGPWCPLW